MWSASSPNTLADVIEPRAGVAGVTRLDRRRAIQIEAAHAAALDPAAFRDQPVAHQHGQPRAQVICSTGLCWSSHALAGTLLLSGPGMGAMRALTLLAGHISRDGA